MQSYGNVHIVKQYAPIILRGVNGKFSNINGLYIPVYSNTTMDIVYKKSDDSHITIQYCDKIRSWKLFDEGKGTLARISATTSQIPLDNIRRKTYWEIYNDDVVGGFEIQPYAHISLI
jgi:hypothetical protein